MKQIRHFLLILICMMYAFSAFADGIKPIDCKDFKGLSEIKQKIISIDQAFQWNSSNCKVVGTKSIFPRQNKNGQMNFEKGLQIFVYDDYQLKFICLPGWNCKKWN